MTAITARLKEIEGTYNLRDLGGYRADGGETQWGRLFRSDELARLSDTGMTAFTRLGVRNVVDLRDDRERQLAPNRLPDGVRLIPHPVFPDAFEHVSKRLDIGSMTELIYFQHADTLAGALGVLAEAEEPTLFHCHAGKDRTGAVAALTLTAIGVDRDDVLHDYAETEKNLAGEWLENRLAVLDQTGVARTPDVMGLIATSPIPVLDHALKLIEREFGSVRDYLLTNGLEESSIEALHRRLVS